MPSGISCSSVSLPHRLIGIPASAGDTDIASKKKKLRHAERAAFRTGSFSVQRFPAPANHRKLSAACLGFLFLGVVCRMGRLPPTHIVIQNKLYPIYMQTSILLPGGGSGYVFLYKKSTRAFDGPGACCLLFPCSFRYSFFRFRRRYSSSLALTFSGISRETGHFTASAMVPVKSARKPMSETICASDRRASVS